MIFDGEKSPVNANILKEASYKETRGSFVKKDDAADIPSIYNSQSFN